ncbi:enoyl-CoA hydratase-related protein [Marinobacterium sediminicola]|uniref:Enoyl-CoA hydratase/carnithine racemase n=1 Tax=Marinobacterium sediminicola TaxID=518898 RepID=A0ABY1S2G6_9GAMM|nr:enoyl-CoA hydratase-related protein [Marinobacterium sediminicola]ULG70683.1 enoyl-CoA hydratase-related protein [Marinobacterium sediminicola]SMR77220.1 Enoyl-CoA hydratase/carnithine racemase [Marinobacterium sediminicola]
MDNTPKLRDARLTLEERVAVLTLDRDDLRNALTGTALIDDIVETVHWANRSSDVSVLIITGSGSAFCAGGNIKEMQYRDGDHRTGPFGGTALELEHKYRHGIQRIPLAIHQAEVPIIAAINGPAIGAGCDLACMCDIRIGSERATFGETFVNLGIIPGDGGAWFLQRLIGYQRAAEITLTGRLVHAEEAVQLGLMMEQVPADQLMQRALTLARQMASKPPHALRMSKRLMKQAQRQELPDFLELCAAWQGMLHNTDDHAEAVNAFVEKREGNYRGR